MGRTTTHEGRRAARPWPYYAATALGVAAAAVTGARSVDPDSDWYRGLSKPPWQPPPWVFGVVWPPLYASVAWAGGRALARARGGRRRAVATGLAANLALNAGWNRLFFGCRSPKAGVVGTLLLDISNAELIRRSARADTTAALALVPYAAWCGFATALSLSVARRNP